VQIGGKDYGQVTSIVTVTNWRHGLVQKGDWSVITIRSSCLERFETM
jgi:hypothetical protein